MRRSLSVVLLPLLAASLYAPPLPGQRPELGVLLGHSFVGGGDSRTLVDVGGLSITGADWAGTHARVFLDFPIRATPISIRTDLFYNRLSSGPNTVALVGNGSGYPALSDRTLGLVGSLVARARRGRLVVPYVSLGAGLFSTRLGTNPDAQSGIVTQTTNGMGMGLAAGGGLELRLHGRLGAVLDWRYHQGLYNTRGSSFMPLSVGLRW